MRTFQRLSDNSNSDNCLLPFRRTVTNLHERVLISAENERRSQEEPAADRVGCFYVNRWLKYRKPLVTSRKSSIFARNKKEI